MATRREAEQTKAAFQGLQIGQANLKVGWACGYGPREDFNYAEGVLFYEISKIPESDISYIESSFPRGGGAVKGGTVMEEPNVAPNRSSNFSQGNKRPAPGTERDNYQRPRY
jgi:hypothetical protein